MCTREQDIHFTTPAKEELVPAVIAQAGYPCPQVVSIEILSGIDQAVGEALRHSRPRCLYRILPLHSWNRGVLVADGIRIRSVKWAGLVEGSLQPGKLCGFVVTLGEGLDREMARLQGDSLFQAYLVDAAASVLVERMAGQVEGHLAQALGREGYRATARFSPGYCDWEIREGQDALFSLLKPEQIGVRLSSGHMMLPRKTISACMVGARGVPCRVPCPDCTRRECPYRRAVVDPEREEGRGGLKRPGKSVEPEDSSS